MPQYVDERVDTLLNPLDIVEVHSRCSWVHDHVTKGGLYRKMPACPEYWLIDFECVKAEHWTRTGVNEWRLQFIEDINAVFALTSLGIEFLLALLYFDTLSGELPDARPSSWQRYKEFSCRTRAIYISMYRKCQKATLSAALNS